MDISLTTPALLFPAISLLLLAYTNRFLALAALIRQLHNQYREEQCPILIDELDNLSVRVRLIRNMQAFGTSSLLLCVICMFVLFAGWALIGKLMFGLSLLLLIYSLALSVWEIYISVHALNIHIGDIAGEIGSSRKA